MRDYVSVIIVAYNSERYLEPCISSIQKQDYPHEIIVVDNNSTDSSRYLLINKFPMVKLIENHDNMGYGGGNNLGISYATGKYVVIINPDTLVQEGWLRELVKPLLNNDKVITTPKILSYDGTSINTCGIMTHFTGLAFTRGLLKNYNLYSRKEVVSGFSGCCFAITKKNYKYLGGFDKNFFLYQEDSDLSWNANLNEFTILFIPTSIIRHDYILKLSPEKLYHLEKGRYLILRKHLPIKYLLMLIPSLLITEALTFGYAALSGKDYIFYKILATIHGLTINIEQSNGNIKHLLSSLCKTIPEDQLLKSDKEVYIKRIANNIYVLNFSLLNKLLKIDIGNNKL